MKREFLRNLILLSSSAFLFGCAASYKRVHPEAISYVKDNASSPDVIAEYHYNALVETNNRKYHKKEIKRLVQLVAVKVTNNTNSDLEYNKNFKLYSSNSEVSPLPVETVYSALKQQAPLYLLHLLWSFTNVTTSTETTNNGYSRGETKVYPIGLIIGPAVALGNVLVASSANDKFRNELIDHSIFNKVIKKGETKFFLIGLNGSSFQPLSVRVVNSQS